MCGVTGIFLAEASSPVTSELVEACLHLQHRGQDACGVATQDGDGKSVIAKGIGLVTEVFGQEAKELLALQGNIGVGHVRYRTAGKRTLAEVQPLHATVGPDILLCHNGHLAEQAPHTDSIDLSPFDSDIKDSALILEAFSRRLSQDTLGILSLTLALESVYRFCRGAFACVAAIAGTKLVGFRDPHGLKPLMLGERSNVDGSCDYMFASESVVLDKLGFTRTRNVLPGEAIIVGRSDDGIVKAVSRQVVPALSYTPDIFEYVYFARPDSHMDGISVQLARQNIGSALGSHIKSQLDVSDIDVVIPIPETSYIGALAAAKSLDVPFAFGLVKNSYVGRTFIMPGQEQRQKGVRRKLSAVATEFADRHVLLLDDSIVRGTTSRTVVQMAYSAGARKVTLASYSPTIRFNHIHGIDLANKEDLIAHNRTNEQIREALGCDNLVYLPLEDLTRCCLELRTKDAVQGFETGVFSGKYVSQHQDEASCDAAAMKRSDSGVGVLY